MLMQPWAATPRPALPPKSLPKGTFQELPKKPERPCMANKCLGSAARGALVPASLLWWRRRALQWNRGATALMQATRAATERVGQARPQRKRWLHSKAGVKPGERLEGTVKDIHPTYALLDVGMDVDATLHASRVKPAGADLDQLFSFGQKVGVWVCGSRPMTYKTKEGKYERIEGRLEVSMFDPQTELGTDVAEFAELPAKTWLSATVTFIEPFGITATVWPPSGGVPVQGFVHVADIREGYVEHPADEVAIGQDIGVNIVRVDKRFGRLRLTMKVEGY